MAERAKAKAIRRTREAAICVLDGEVAAHLPADLWARAVEDYLKTTVDVMMKVAAIMSGQPLPRRRGRSSRPKPAKSAAWVIRLQPQWSVHTPPVHLNAGDDGSKMQHGLAERMAWRD